MALTNSSGSSSSYKVSDRMLRVVGSLGRSTTTTSASDVHWWDEVRPLRPTWGDELERSLDSLTALPQGWDGEGASGVSEVAASEAEQLLARVAVDGAPRPFLAPTAEGGVSFEWRSPACTVIVEVEPDGDESALFQHRLSGYIWEGPLTEAPDDLEKWLWVLSNDAAL